MNLVDDYFQKVNITKEEIEKLVKLRDSEQLYIECKTQVKDEIDHL